MNKPIYVSVYEDTFLTHAMPEFDDQKISAMCDYDNVVYLRVSRPDIVDYLTESGMSLDWYLHEHTADDNENLIPWLIAHGKRFELSEYDRYDLMQKMTRWIYGAINYEKKKCSNNSERIDECAEI